MLIQLTHRLLVCLLAGAVLFAATGFTPIWLTFPQSSAAAYYEWFPCKDHHCGCLNAEMCRTRCCCAKPAQPAQTAARSCCAVKQAPSEQAACATGGDARAVPGLVIQAAGCAGRDAFWVMKAFCWVVPSPPLAPRGTNLAQQTRAQVVQLEAQCGLLPDPPPPRAG